MGNISKYLKELFPSIIDTKNKIINGTVGSDTLGNGTTHPYRTIGKAVNVAQFPADLYLFESFTENVVLTNAKSNINLIGSKIFNKFKVELNGNIQTSSADANNRFVRLGVYGINVKSGANSPVVLGSFDGGKHCFENVAFTTSAVSLVSIPSNFYSIDGAWLNFLNCDFSNSLTSVLVLPNLDSTNTATLRLYNCGFVNISVGKGWTVYYTGDTVLNVVSKYSTALIIDLARCFRMNSIITSQVALDALIAITNHTADGAYLINFAGPTGITGIAAGDIILKNGSVHMITMKYADAPAQVMDFATNVVYVKKGTLWGAIATVGFTGAYSDLTGKPTLGTAAALDVGVDANEVVQMGSDGKLPAVDGSKLTGVTALAIADARPSTKCKYLKSSRNRISRDDMAFIMDDGVLKGCGIGLNGSAIAGGGGTGSYTQVFLPTPIAIDPINPPMTEFVEVHKVNYQGWALTADGDVYSWGLNAYGQLGHGNTQDQNYAKRIQYFYNNGIKIRAIIPQKSIYQDTKVSVFFITDDNKLYACGSNYVGQLGLGDLVDRSTPTRVGSFTNIRDVVITSGWGGSTYINTSDNKLYVCGYNLYGQLGLGDTINKSTPVDTGLSNITKVDATLIDVGTIAYGCAFALTNTGAVYVCGYNGYGALGMGDTLLRNSWTLNPNITGITNVYCDGNDGNVSAVIDGSGNLKLAGNNKYGQQGVNNTAQQNSFHLPDAVNGDCSFQGKIAKVLIFGGSDSYSTVAVLDTDGNVYACGYGGYGQCSTGINASPNTVFKKLINAKLPYETRKAIDIGSCGYFAYTSLFVLYDDGLVRACGRNSNGQLGTTAQPDWGITDFLRDVNF